MAESASEYAYLELFEAEYWRVGLHPKQSYLGRSVAVLKRELADPLLCTREERDELWEKVLPTLQSAIVAVCSPDRLNYGHLANEFLQVHWHIVPRYENPNHREFEEITFIDSKPGRNYAPHPEPPAELTDTHIQHLRQALKAELPT